MAVKGAFALSGVAASLKRGLALQASAGAIQLSAADIAFIYRQARRMTAETGAFTLTGRAASLSPGSAAIYAYPLLGRVVSAGSLSGEGLIAYPLSGRVVNA